MISWLQGDLDTQWTLKSWPLRRAVIKYFGVISLDSHGMVEGSGFFCPPVLELVICMLYTGAVLIGTGKQCYSRVVRGRRRFHLRTFDEISQPMGSASPMGPTPRLYWATCVASASVISTPSHRALRSPLAVSILIRVSCTTSLSASH